MAARFPNSASDHMPLPEPLSPANPAGWRFGVDLSRLAGVPCSHGLDLTETARRGATSAVIATAFLLAATLTIPSASSAADRPLTPRFSANVQGDIALAGNTLMSCPAAAPGCLAARNGIGPDDDLDNEAYNMRLLDIDGDGATFTSSSADLILPPDAEVLFAGLYFGGADQPGSPGTGPPNPGARNRAFLRAPGQAAYTEYTASAFDLNTFPGGVAFQGFADITQTVRAAGPGTYTAANVQLREGIGRHGGWTIIVAYRERVAPEVRNLTVFDGRVGVQTGETTSAELAGILTPPSGEVLTSAGFLAYDGDLGNVGDFASLEGIDLADAANPADNFFNSTISRFGDHVTTKNPDFRNQLGHDIDLVDASGILPNGATSATVEVSAPAGGYSIGAVTLATEIFAPRIVLTKTATDENGGKLALGDVVSFEVEGVNEGEDGATEVVLTDAIPAGMRYFPNTLEVTAGEPLGPKSDASGDDQAAYESGQLRVRFNLGAGATVAQGGTLAPGEGFALRFRARLEELTGPGTEIRNQAFATYRSESNGAELSSQSDETVEVSQPSLPGDCANRVTGTEAGDRIEGTAAGDRLLGLGGDDELRGNAGEDCLEGGEGADLLVGGPGEDIVVGGAGVDRLLTADGERDLLPDCSLEDKVSADPFDSGPCLFRAGRPVPPPPGSYEEGLERLSCGGLARERLKKSKGFKARAGAYANAAARARALSERALAAAKALRRAASRYAAAPSRKPGRARAGAADPLARAAGKGRGARGGANRAYLRAAKREAKAHNAATNAFNRIRKNVTPPQQNKFTKMTKRRSQFKKATVAYNRHRPACRKPPKFQKRVKTNIKKAKSLAKKGGRDRRKAQKGNASANGRRIGAVAVRDQELLAGVVWPGFSYDPGCGGASIDPLGMIFYGSGGSSDRAADIVEGNIADMSQGPDDKQYFDTLRSSGCRVLERQAADGTNDRHHIRFGGIQRNQALPNGDLYYRLGDKGYLATVSTPHYDDRRDCGPEGGGGPVVIASDRQPRIITPVTPDDAGHGIPPDGYDVRGRNYFEQELHDAGFVTFRQPTRAPAPDRVQCNYEARRPTATAFVRTEKP